MTEKRPHTCVNTVNPMAPFVPCQGCADMTPEEIGHMRGLWTLTLNRYQRDNLLWLIGLTGWHSTTLGPALPPFTLLNTGDWLGEIGYMLSPSQGHGNPNVTRDTIAKYVEAWKATPGPGAEGSK